jgi:hypothetical protein
MEKPLRLLRLDPVGVELNIDSDESLLCKLARRLLARGLDGPPGGQRLVVQWEYMSNKS